MTRRQIYLDYNASTPLADGVRTAMAPFFLEHHGNPSSQHWASLQAAAAVSDARAHLATLLGAQPDEVFFTSGGSESNNWAIKGVFAHAKRTRSVESPHYVISAIEHPSVTNACRYLENFGARTTKVGVDRHGLVRPSDIADAVTEDTVLVSVMHANNEVGTLQPIAEIAAIAHAAGALCHTDAAQSVGKVAVDMDTLGVDLLTVAGHKLYAPKGVGALVARSGTPVDPFIHGGGHERGQRAGTENVPYAVALGAAALLARDQPVEEEQRVLSERLWQGLQARFSDRVVLLGHPTNRLPNTVNVGFVGRVGAEILAQMPEVAASTGSACHEGVRSLSPVLAAMGIAEEVGLGAVRFSLGRDTTRDDIDALLERLEEVL